MNPSWPLWFSSQQHCFLFSLVLSVSFFFRICSIKSSKKSREVNGSTFWACFYDHTTLFYCLFIFQHILFQLPQVINCLIWSNCAIPKWPPPSLLPLRESPAFCDRHRVSLLGLQLCSVVCQVSRLQCLLILEKPQLAWSGVDLMIRYP